jgi:poly[(R)-3-hydroxyalkanoate] polymerase subunit PhaE
MSNKYRTPFDELDWSEMQKKYMDALMAFKSPESTMDPVWVNAMDDWWKTAKTDMPYESSNIFEKVLDQCRNYYFMSEQFSGLLDGMNRSKNNKDQITDYINKSFKEIESAFSSGKNTFNLNGFLDNFEQPIDLMKSAFSNSSFDPGEILDGLNPDLGKLRDQMLSIPGLGYSREAQDKSKYAIKLLANYQENYQEYQSVMLRLNQEALDLMRERIISMSKDGESIDSMRQIYDLWIESNEKVYGDYVYTKEYAELNGRLVNSMMAFKKQSHEITEDMLSELHMPTIKSMDELERRHYELRKQVNEMRAEINNLKKQLQKNNSKTVVVKKESKPVARRKKKTKKRLTVNSSNVVELKQVKKKVANTVKAVKKKTKQKTKKTFADKGMIEIKF